MGYGLTPFDGYEEQRKYEKMVETLSVPYDELCRLNHQIDYEISLFGDFDHRGLPPIGIYDPDDIDAFNMQHVLNILCEQDIIRAELFLARCKEMIPLKAEYESKLNKILSQCTPTDKIPYDCDRDKFLYAERDMCNRYKLSASHFYDSRNVPGFFLYDISDSPYMVTFVWNEMARENRIHPWRHIVRMDPPWRVKIVTFEQKQLEQAIVWSRNRGRSAGIEETDAMSAIIRANGRCPFCDQPVSRCGTLGAYSLIPNGYVYIDNHERAHGNSYVVQAMCQRCNHLWQSGFSEWKRKDENKSSKILHLRYAITPPTCKEKKQCENDVRHAIKNMELMQMFGHHTT